MRIHSSYSFFWFVPNLLLVLVRFQLVYAWISTTTTKAGSCSLNTSTEQPQTLWYRVSTSTSSEQTMKSSSSSLFLRLPTMSAILEKEDTATVVTEKGIGTENRQQNKERQRITPPPLPTSDDTLTFRANYSSKSSPVPLASPEIIVKYFKDPNESPLLSSFGPNIVSARISNPPPHILAEWESQCRLMGANVPSHSATSTRNEPTDDVVLSIKTAGVKIPGLVIEWSAYVGATLILPEKQSQGDETLGLPSMEMVLIKDDCTARGLRPLVWIFETLTKHDRNDQRRTRPSSLMTQNRETRFLTRIAMKHLRQNDQEGEEEKLFFDLQGTIEIQFKIPAVLARVLGGTAKKAKHEERLSKLIQNRIEEDSMQTLAIWQEKYRQWVETHGRR